MYSNFFLTVNLLLTILLLNCNDIERPGLETLLLFQGSPNNIGVVTSDFGGGGRYNVVDPRAGFALPGLTPIHSDASVRFYNNRIYIINRLNRDTIQALNPNFANITEIEFSIGQGSNPQDILILNPNKAYISRFNRTSILIVNPSNGTEIGEIDLASYSEEVSAGGLPDGNPEMSWMIQAEGRVFIILQRLDRNSPTGFLPPSGISYLLEIDPITDKPLQKFNFQSSNPLGKPQILNLFGEPHIVVATPAKLGFISQLDGGVEAFNLNSNKFRPGFLLNETTAGGDILGVQIKSDNEGYASVLDSSFNKKIIQFNPSNGSITTIIAEVSSQFGTNFSGLLLTSEGLLAVGISDFGNPGINIYDTNGSLRQITIAPIRTELTPTDLIELR
ncbi:hypothetical protein [Leptospira sp. GIMC2001]|uniref:hypothetical protein n=1 Tax=Leptospira sp. GIMC2001 TaxID=1513297 RepID=UPI00234A5096|nr:hypothetical protein [Leptospira sp. GIMC2001]WCL50024.1 hypothetical protein O4O04_04175 [Leptospira sp. GIMC2001]